MSRLCLTLLVSTFGTALMAAPAAAQYYNPAPAPQYNPHSPGGVGLDLGFRNGGWNPAIGAGIGPIGAGIFWSRPFYGRITRRRVL